VLVSARDRVEPDRDERGEQDEQQLVLDGHHGVRQAERDEAADGEDEAVPQRRAVFDRPARQPERPLLADLSGRASRVLVEQEASAATATATASCSALVACSAASASAASARPAASSADRSASFDARSAPFAARSASSARSALSAASLTPVTLPAAGGRHDG
jgi:hypothetical protein